MAAIDYYEDSSQWGNYQYITMEEIINNFLMSRDDDDYTSSTQRFKILYQARRAMREFYYDVLREIRAIEIELSPSLQVTLPPDFVNYVRISWVNANGELKPMAVDNRINIAEEYLQDNNYELLFDNQGCVLIGEGGGDTPVNPDDDVETSELHRQYSFCNNGGFQPNRDMSRTFANGKYKIDKTRGIIQFGSGVEGKRIVLEYISDGLFTGCEGRPETEIRIHKFAESAVINYIYYELIKTRRKVPYNEKMRAKKEYWNSRRLTKLRINALRKDEILQSFRKASQWIK
jgi:hypothetical protein